MESQRLKVALDLGVGSIGLAICRTNAQEEILPNTTETFVHIFKPANYNKERREKRLDRRRLKRRRKRKELLWKYLASISNSETIFIKPYQHISPKQFDNDHTLRFSKGVLKKDILFLRAKGTKEKLTSMEIGYLLYYFCNNRLSNNIQENFTKNYGDKFLTIGEYLYSLSKASRRTLHDLSLNRDLIKKELTYILHKQQEYYPNNLTSEVIQNIIKIIDYEKYNFVDIKTKCPYFPNERLLRLTSHYYEQRRILEFCNNLRIELKYNGQSNSRIPLPRTSYRNIYSHLMMGVDLAEYQMHSFIGAIATADGNLTLDYNIIHTSTVNKPYVRGNSIAKIKNIPFISLLKDEEIETVLEVYFSSLNKNYFIEYLNTKHFLSKEEANNIYFSLESYKLKRGFSRIGSTVTQMVIDLLQSSKFNTYEEAINHLIFTKKIKTKNIPLYKKLPSYNKALNEYITVTSNSKRANLSNLVVHKALNRLRVILNEVIDKYGVIDEIFIEYSKELEHSFKQNNDFITEENLKNKEKRLYLAELKKYTKENISDKQLLMYKLTLQQGLVCPYSSHSICISDILEGTLELDHIIPYSICFDNSISNLLVTFRKYNQLKASRTPYQAFFGTNYWNNIIAFLEYNKPFARQKGWLFKENALEVFQEKSQFFPRYKNDISIIAKITIRYLQCLFYKKNKINIARSSFISVIRKHWNFNNISSYWTKDYLNTFEQKIEFNIIEKNRVDIRHHALDALILLLLNIKQTYLFTNIMENKKFNWQNLQQLVLNTDNKITQQIFNLVSNANEYSFRGMVSNIVKNSNVSFQHKYKKSGQLHKETLYRFYRNIYNENKCILTFKKHYFSDELIRNWDYDTPEVVYLNVKKELFIQESLIKHLNAEIVERYHTYLCNILHYEDGKFNKLNTIYKNIKSKENSINDKIIWIKTFKYFWSMNKKGYLRFMNFDINKLIVLKYPGLTFEEYGYGYITGNNFCVDLYYDGTRIKGEIIRRYQILNKNYVPNYVKQNFTRKLRLLTGDIIEVDYVLKDKFLSCPYTSAPKGRVRLRITAFTETNNSIDFHLKLLNKSGYNKDFSRNLNSLLKLNMQKLVLSSLGFEKYRSSIINL